ncbi:hypothetical protein UlMin_011708 [Ulmus minor]
MKKCELCDSTAKMYCESDRASLCWDCDARVHGANFLVTKHTRTLLCHVCQSLTPWNGSGPKLSPTVSVCEKCVHGCHPNPARNQEEEENDEEDDDNGDDIEDEDEDEEEDEDEDDGEEDEENQVVPWSSAPPPPPASSSSSNSEDCLNSFSNSDDSFSRSRQAFSWKRMCYNAGLSSKNQVSFLLNDILIQKKIPFFFFFF